MPKATRSGRTRLIPRDGHSFHFALSPIFLGHSKARGRCSQGEWLLYGRDLCCSVT
jgi:hypothetical protein